MVPEEQDPITDDEIVFRRIPAGAEPRRYDPNTKELSDQAFAPHKKNDADGLSISRAKYKTVEEAAIGQPGKYYYVAVLRAGDIRSSGIELVASPNVRGGIDPAHALLPGLNSDNYKSTETQEKQRILKNLCLRVDGPFLTPTDS